MRIFVTGATGFIGKHLVNKLKNDNDITINLYDDEVSPFGIEVLTYKLDENFPDRDIEFLRNRFDGIIHLASLYLTVHEPVQVAKLIDANVKFGSYILECAARANVSWFINTGTVWQNYENKEYSPVNLYAATKQAFESVAKYYVESNQIKFCTLRLSDTYGPNDTRPKIFNLWERIGISGEVLEMSPGNQIIDICHVYDVVDAYYILSSLLNNESKEILSGDVFTVCDNQRYQLRELAEIFERVTSMKLNINWGAKPYRLREVMKPWDKGRNVPGWKKNISVEKGLLLQFGKK